MHDRYHRRKRRDVRREVALEVLPLEAVEENSSLTEDDLLSLADEIAIVRQQLDESDRLIFDVCLQGESVAQIAELVQKSRWTVRRSLNRTGELLRAKLCED